ncbi:PD-(D/E)XK nuclease superfamily protein [Halotia wernerae UHCC 0503]|nr:PD-(D/E)XK nuclease superfamily protein [Halotia wernerae UHCC 0503]
MTQGARAVTSGNVLEKTVEGALLGHKYVQVGFDLPKKQRFEWLVSSKSITKRYAKQVYIGEGIYGSDIYVDFYIIGSASISSGLIIECKWQQTSGSVDEKLPYLNLNIQKCYPTQALVLIDGGGMKVKAISWLAAQVTENQNLLAVHNLSSFLVWSNNHL